MDTLIDAAALKDRLDGADGTGQRTVVLDVRWALGDPHGHDHYLRGHIPGAVFVDLRHRTRRTCGAAHADAIRCRRRSSSRSPHAAGASTTATWS